jgi:hypothetical protein
MSVLIVRLFIMIHIRAGKLLKKEYNAGIPTVVSVKFIALLKTTLILSHS